MAPILRFSWSLRTALTPGQLLKKAFSMPTRVGGGLAHPTAEHQNCQLLHVVNKQKLGSRPPSALCVKHAEAAESRGRFMNLYIEAETKDGVT